MRKNNLVAARLCYNEALDYLVPNFECLKANLSTMGFDDYLSNKMKDLSKEIAMIFGNRSTVMLKEGDVKIATLDAQQSLKYYPTAKVLIHINYCSCVIIQIMIIIKYGI